VTIKKSIGQRTVQHIGSVLWNVVFKNAVTLKTGLWVRQGIKNVTIR